MNKLNHLFIPIIIIATFFIVACHHPTTIGKSLVMADSLVEQHKYSEAKRFLKSFLPKTSKQKAIYYLLYTRIEISDNRIPNSTLTIDSCITFFEENAENRYLAQAYAAKAQIMQAKNNNQHIEAVKLLKKAQHIADNEEDDGLKANIYYQLAQMNFHYGIYTLAAIYASKGTIFAHKANDTLIIRRSSAVASQAYTALNMIDSAHIYAYKGMKPDTMIYKEKIPREIIYNIEKSQADYDESMTKDITKRYNNGITLYHLLYFLFAVIAATGLLMLKLKTTSNVKEKAKEGKKQAEAIKKLEKRLEIEIEKRKKAFQQYIMLKKEMEQLIARHQKSLAHTVQTRTEAMIQGEKLYKEVNERKNISQWSKYEEKSFVDYYMVRNQTFAEQIKSTYKALTPHQLIVLILINEDMNEDTIMKVMMLTNGNLRKIKSVINAKKKIATHIDIKFIYFLRLLGYLP